MIPVDPSVIVTPVGFDPNTSGSDHRRSTGQLARGLLTWVIPAFVYPALPWIDYLNNHDLLQYVCDFIWSFFYLQTIWYDMSFFLLKIDVSMANVFLKESFFKINFHTVFLFHFQGILSIALAF